MSKSCIHEGDLIVAAGQTVTTDATEVTGSIRVGGNATLTAPVLAQARDVRVWGTLNAPLLAQARDVRVGDRGTLIATAAVLAKVRSA